MKTTPQEFLASYLREKAAAFAEANAHLAPVHRKYFGQPLINHAEDFLLADRSDELFEHVVASDRSATIITLHRFKSGEIHWRYQLALAGDTWKIIRIDRACLWCSGTGKSEGAACTMCHGEGYIDARG